MSDLSYQIINPAGTCVMHAPEICRYPRNVELQLLEDGYTIKLNGKLVAKSNIKASLRSNTRQPARRTRSCR